MAEVRDRAIILRSVAFEDRHRIVTAITEAHGRVSALARNSVQSRRFGGALELFTAADWIWNQRFESSELLQLQEAQALRSHEGIRLDFQKMAMASLFSELMVRVSPEREACLDLFKLHANALAALEEGVFSPTPPIALLNGYLAKLLQWSGNQPRFQHCLDCGKTLQSYWEAGSSQVAVLTMVVQAGGWICSECRIQGLTHIQERSEIQGIEILEVGTDAMADCLMSLVTPIRQVPLTAHASDSAHRSLFRVLEAFLVFHLPGFDRLPLKSLQFLGLESSLRSPLGPSR
ncbi:MAG: hypothetical protein RJB38_1403 [Pseudomonadota bacterium]